MDMKKEMGKRIKKARLAAGYDQQKIAADELGLDRTRYTKYEIGDNYTPIEVLTRICRTFNVSADWLLGLREDHPELRQIKKPAGLADLGVEQVQKAGADQLTPEEVAAIRMFLRLRSTD